MNTRTFLLLPWLLYGSTIWAESSSPDHALKNDPSWHDGKAEVSTYALTYPRYGEPRQGKAAAIFVTEPISRATRVKVEKPGHDPKDMLQVMKLNLTKHFTTGVYDYHLMTSTFLALEPLDQAPAGSVAKVSFSAQEWCGHVYQQLLFKHDGVHDSWHSYFQSEGNGQQTLPPQPMGLSEDALLLWARGWAEPVLKPGESRDVKLLMSVERSRMQHQPVTWLDATVSSNAEVVDVQTELGNIPARQLTAVTRGDKPLTLTFTIEAKAPNRVLAWQSSDGQKATIIASQRMPYWIQNANSDEKKRLPGQ